jgi:hypothetical protein
MKLYGSAALTKTDEFKAIDMNVPEDPLFGHGFGGFRHLIPNMKSTREYTIVSKQYNRIDKVDGYSVSRWRLADGREILGKAIDHPRCGASRLFSRMDARSYGHTVMNGSIPAR